MCELLALHFNQRISPSFTFRGFLRRGIVNPDGWGLAYYEDIATYVYKEPIESNESKLAEELRQNPAMQSKIFLSHVRLASVGSVSLRNTQPYMRALDDREYVFAHNGTVSNFKELPLSVNFQPHGDTDSEFLFCHLISEIKQNTHGVWNKKSFHWLHHKLYELNRLGTVNILISDGEFVFAYHDKNGYNGLHFTERKAPYDIVHLLDEDWQIDLSYEKDPSVRGVIIASVPLTDEKWHRFENGELRVYRDGQLVYSSSSSSLNHLVRKIKQHDCAVICPYRSEYSEKENRQRARNLELKLIGFGYRTYIVIGSFVEHMGASNSHEVNTDLYFITDWKNRGKLEADLMRLCEEYKSESVLFIPKGGGSSVLIGNSGNSPKESSERRELPILEDKDGTPNILLRVEGSPFIFAEDGIIGEFWAGGYLTRGYAGVEGRKDWQEYNIDEEEV